MESPPAAKPLLNSQLRRFLLAMVLANIAGNMYGSLLPLYLRQLRADVVQVGLFFTLSRIFPLILQILGGWLSDSLGRLRSIALGSLAGVVSYAGLILAPTWQWVLLGEGLGAVTRSLIGPSFPAFIAEQSAEENRARVFGVAQFIFGVVTVVGPPLGGWLAGARGFRFMLFCAAGIYTMAALIRVHMAREVAQAGAVGAARPSLKGLLGNLGLVWGMILAGGIFTWIVITDGIGDVSFSLSFDLLPVYMDEEGGLAVQHIGWLFSIFGVSSMATNILAGWLADRKGERVVIVLGFALNFVALVLFLRASGFLGFAAAWALFGTGYGMVQPAHQSLTSKVVPDRLRGTAFGLVQGGLGLFSLPAPAVGAQLWDKVNPRFPFQLTAGATLLSIIPAWFKFKLPDRPTADEEVTSEA